MAIHSDFSRNDDINQQAVTDFIQKYDEIVSSDDFKNKWSPEERAEFKKEARKIYGDIQSEISDFNDLNEKFEVETERQNLRDSGNEVRKGMNFLEKAEWDYIKGLNEHNQGTFYDLMALGNSLVGDTKSASKWQQKHDDLSENARAMAGEAKSFTQAAADIWNDNDGKAWSEFGEASLSAVTDLGALMTSVPTVLSGAAGKALGLASKGNAMMRGASKMWGTAVANKSGQLAIKAAGDWVKGQSLKSIPTYISMSLPEVYRNLYVAKNTDEMGNFLNTNVAPTFSETLTSALVAIPHSWVESWGIDPMKIADAPTKKVASVFFKDFVKGCLGEGTEEVIQDTLSKFNENLARKPLGEAFGATIGWMCSKEGLLDNINSFLGGAIGGAGMHGGSAVASIYKGGDGKYHQGVVKTKADLAAEAKVHDLLANNSANIDDETYMAEEMGLINTDEMKEGQAKLIELQKLADEQQKILEDSKSSIEDKQSAARMLGNLETQMEAIAQVLGFQVQTASEIIRGNNNVSSLASEALSTGVAPSLNLNPDPNSIEYTQRVADRRDEGQSADNAEQSNIESMTPEQTDYFDTLNRIYRETQTGYDTRDEFFDAVRRGEAIVNEDGSITKVDRDSLAESANEILRNNIDGLNEDEKQTARLIARKAESAVQSGPQAEEEFNAELEKAKSAPNKSASMNKLIDSLSGYVQRSNAEASQSESDQDISADEGQSVNAEEAKAETPSQSDKAKEVPSASSDAVGGRIFKSKRAAKAYIKQKKLRNHGIRDLGGGQYEVYDKSSQNVKKAAQNAEKGFADSEANGTVIKGTRIYDSFDEANEAMQKLNKDTGNLARRMVKVKKADGTYGYVIKEQKGSFLTEKLKGRNRVSSDELQRIVDNVRSRLKNKDLNIEIHEDERDYLGDQAETGYAEGFYDNGTIHLFRSNIKDADRAKRVLLHELTHYGFSQLLDSGEKKNVLNLFNKFAKNIGRDGNGNVLFDVGGYIVALNQKYMDSKSENASEEVIEEIIANMAEKYLSNPKTFTEKAKRFLQQIVSAVRRGLRSLGFDIGLSNSEVITFLRDIRSNIADQGILFENDEPMGSMTRYTDDNGRRIPSTHPLYSLLRESEIKDNSDRYFEAYYNGNGKKKSTLTPIRENPSMTREALDACNEQIAQMQKLMQPFYEKTINGNRYLPEEVYGASTLFDNASYGKTMENTTVCWRTLAYIKFCDEVKKKIGRPLTVRESFLVSQKIYDMGTDPQCLYCYVSLDRKSYDEALLKYTQQRDSALSDYTDNVKDKSARLPAQSRAKKERSANTARVAETELGKVYLRYLNGREDSPVQRDRFNSWLDIVNGDNKFVGNADLATKDIRHTLTKDKVPQSWKNCCVHIDSIMADESLSDGQKKKKISDFKRSAQYKKAWDEVRNTAVGQILDAEAYAQASSWQKKEEDYRSYMGELLTTSKSALDKVMSHYGLRFYSFSEYTGAFILENMQMVRDAALRGLKGFAYTKKADFARIFAPTGMNFNIGCYGRRDSKGNVVMDERQGANWDEVKKLRKQYDGVGAVFVAVDDDMVRWALDQDWIDVIIPFHIVRTGDDIAKYYGWTNFKADQEDQLVKDNGKTKVDNIYPHQHHNSKSDFIELAKSKGWISKGNKDNKFTPRFEQFIDHPNYMRLVNETRRTADDTPVLNPTFDMKAAKKAFKEFTDVGGYYNNFYRPEYNFDEEISLVAEDIRQGKEPMEVDYGRQDLPIDFFDKQEKKANDRSKSRTHGRRFSLVTNRDEIEMLEKSPKTYAYRAMALIDGKLYPPMASKWKDDGDRIKQLAESQEIGKWYKADERPNKIKGFKTDSKTGRVYGQIEITKDNGKSLTVAYNPYFHSSFTPLNDQFSEAYNRPNLVVVKVELSDVDLNSGYRAENAKDSVGETKWKSGIVSGQLAKAGKPSRKVYLTQYAKVVKILPDSEVASAISEMLKGTDVEIPTNVVTPSLLRELKSIGVKTAKPRFSYVKNIELPPNKRVSSATTFSGGGLIEAGLEGIIAPKAALEYDSRIASVYRDNHGSHMIVGSVLDHADVKKMYDQAGKNLGYFHASPVCHNFSMAKNDKVETTEDIAFARSTAEAITKMKPNVFTCENAPLYLNSKSFKVIAEALDKNGYTWDAKVYHHDRFGGATKRTRLIVRAVRNGYLPLVQERYNVKDKSWYESVKDLIKSAPRKATDFTARQKELFGNTFIKGQPVLEYIKDKNKAVWISGNGHGKWRVSSMEEPAPTITARGASEEFILLPNGEIKEVTPRMVARLMGLPDSYKVPSSKTLAHLILGNGVPTEITRAVILPLLTDNNSQGPTDDSNGPKSKRRFSYVNDTERPSEANADEARAYAEAVKDLGDTEELKTILDNAKKNNTLGKAPNGEQSNLEPTQWLTVRTKQFKDWFGDWEKGQGSKVVDENGEPMVVWTGTDSAFNEFKPKKIGTRTDSGMSGKGFYFGKKNYAKRYEGRKGVTRAFFLNIQNPIIVKGMGTNETAAWNSKNVKEAKERLDYWKFLSDDKKAVENIIDSIDDDYLNNLNSYDGVIRINTDDNEGIKEYYNEIVIRDSSQAKLADPVTHDDKGEVIPLSQRFNKVSKDIRYCLVNANEIPDIKRHFVERNSDESFDLVRKKVNKLKAEGRFTSFSSEDVANINKELGEKFPELEGPSLLKAILKNAIGKKDIEFKIDKNIIHAYVTQKGAGHLRRFNRANDVGKVFTAKLDYIANTSEYVYSTDNQEHTNNYAKDVEFWDDFVSVIEIGGRFYSVLFALRKMMSEKRHQVYGINIKGENRTGNVQEADAPTTTYTYAGPSPKNNIPNNTDGVNKPKASYVKEEDEEAPQKKTKASWEEWARQIKHMRDLQEEKRRKKEEFNNMTLAQKIKSFLKELPDKYEQNVSNHKHMLKKFEEEKSPLFENGTIPDNADPHMLLDTVDGRIQNKRDEFYAQNAQPIIDFLKENKITSTDFDLYLFAKHADERDAQINKINPDLAARGIRGSGWNEQSMGTPSAVQERLEKKYPKISEAADMFYKMNDKLLDIQLDYGLVSKDHVENIRKIYPHYCPLKRIDDKSLLDGIIYGDDRDVPNSVSFKSDIQEALGRTSRPEYPFMFALVSLDHVFRNGEMNLCNQALYLFAEKINDPSMQLGQRKVIRKLDPNRGEIVYRYSAELEPQTVVARFKGNPATVHIDDPDVYIAFTSPKSFIGLSNQMARAFRTLTTPLMQNATSRNVEFGLVNAFKDNQQAFIDNANTHGIKAATNILKGFWEGCRTFIDYERGKDTENTRLFKEYLMNGGSTGYLDMLRLDKYADNLEKEINSFMITSPYQKLLMAAKHPFKTADRVLQKTSGYFFKYFELFNEMMETATRFANYKWFRQHGGKDGGEASALRAAEFAKNITLNFNRHGAKWTSEWNWAFMFSNAALQGGVKALKIYRKMLTTKDGIKALVGIILAGIFGRLLNNFRSGVDEEDGIKYYDKIPDYKKKSHVIIMKSNGKEYAQLPLAPVIALPYMFGDNIGAWLTNKISLPQMIGDSMLGILDAVNPLGNDSRPLAVFLPTATRPLFDITTNSTWSGSKIHPEPAPFSKVKYPKWQSHMKDTAQIYVTLCKALNTLSGGNNDTPGAIDLYPDDVSHLLYSYLGGMPRLAAKYASAFDKKSRGENLTWRETPILSRWAGESDDRKDYDLWAQLVDQEAKELDHNPNSKSQLVREIQNANKALSRIKSDFNKGKITDKERNDRSLAVKKHAIKVLAPEYLK